MFAEYRKKMVLPVFPRERERKSVYRKKMVVTCILGRGVSVGSPPPKQLRVAPEIISRIFRIEFQFYSRLQQA